MKRNILLLVTAILFSINTFAQIAINDVTLFLGEPVDGSKSEMIEKLKKKGFTYDEYNDVLKGTFNGYPSSITVHTNNNVVDRIVVVDDVFSSEPDIKIRFNNLYTQFSNNSKYSTSEDYRIPDDEDISYQITVNKKRYESVHRQKCISELDSTIIAAMENVFLTTNKEAYDEYINMEEEKRNEILSIIYKTTVEFNKPVWFYIDKSYSRYRIVMFYDNIYNQSHGEDL